MIPKFRAYNGSINRMYQPEEVLVGDGKIYIDDENFEGWTENNDLSLMQSTSLFDKNGVEIFEGDVVAQTKTQPTTENEKILGVVTMIEGAWLIMNDVDQSACYLWSDDVNEILGNIYENPELVE